LAQDGKESKRMLENITVDNFSTFKSKPWTFWLYLGLAALAFLMWVLSFMGFFGTEFDLSKNPWQDAGTLTLCCLIFVAWPFVMTSAYLTALTIYKENQCWAYVPYAWAIQLLSFQDRILSGDQATIYSSNVEGRKSWSGKRQSVFDSVRVVIGSWGLKDSQLWAWVVLWESLVDVPEYGRKELAVIHEKTSAGSNLYNA
jgi:hypothetical protein